MGRINVKCPLCGHLNEGVDLEETGGWVECENCKTDFAPGEQLERALKNTRVRVTGRDPLVFTVNGCSSLPEFRERLFDQQLGALEYCAELLQAREANAGKIKTLLAVLRGIRNTILVDKDERPRRPLLHVEEGGGKNPRAGRFPAPCAGALRRRTDGVCGADARRALARAR